MMILKTIFTKDIDDVNNDEESNIILKIMVKGT